MKMSKVLKLARVEFKKTQTFLCSCVNFTVAPDKDKARTKQFIMNQLDGFTSLNYWLMARLSLSETPMNHYGQYAEKIRICREMWLNYMIAQCEARGD